MNQNENVDVAKQILYTTVRIDTIDKNGKSWSGTGFITDYEKDDDRYPMIVTNKHVIKNMVKGQLAFLKKKDGKPIIPSKQIIEISNFESNWIGHPDVNVDVTIMPIGGILNKMKEKGLEIYFLTIQKDLFLKNEQLKELSAIQEVIFIGYPSAIRDETNLTPITRRGITASPIHQNFDDNPIFLIDASVFGGSSGSPVFILNQGSYSKPGAMVMGSRVILLGIVAESHYFFEKGEMGKDESITKDIPIGKQYIDLGVVFKSSTITETMEFWAEKNQHLLK